MIQKDNSDPLKEKQSINDLSEPVRWDQMDIGKGSSSSAIQSWMPTRALWLRILERIALWIERPANRLIGSDQLNPFYHTGTIATLLLIIIGLTGFYLYLFYKYGFDASYNDVLTRIETPFIARTIRAIHRYASGALIITTLLHAYRILFMERFRGPRWLAWVSGIVMTGLLWFAGVTGYWLIWDQRSQLINDSFVNFLQTLTPFAASYMVLLTKADLSGISWPIFLIVFAIHLLMFLIAAVFFWLHIKRLNRPKWLPPAYWTIGVSIVVVLVGLLFPAGMLPQGSLQRLPGPVTIDPLFLFYLPVSGSPILSWILWITLLSIVVVSTALPWLRRSGQSGPVRDGKQIGQLPKIRILKERCTGCTLCAVDCPYGAITMVERTDGKIHKFLAVENPNRCVSCGICVGSCDVVAVTLGEDQPELLWNEVSFRLSMAQLKAKDAAVQVVLTCERHAAQGAASYLSELNIVGETAVEVIALPCVGTVPPDMLGKTLQAGAVEVKVVGCPADDCTNREGNLWTEQRLVRERVPRLRRRYANDPIFAHWVPPDDFPKVFDSSLPENKPILEDEIELPNLEQRRIFKDISWRNYLMAFALLAVIMIVQVLLTDLPFNRYPDPPALTQAIVSDLGQSMKRSPYISSALSSQLNLELVVDDQQVQRTPYATADLLAAESTPFYFEYELEPGQHHLQLALVDEMNRISFVLFDSTVDLDQGQIYRYGH